VLSFSDCIVIRTGCGHFLNWLETISPILSWEIPYQCVAGPARITMPVIVTNWNDDITRFCGSSLSDYLKTSAIALSGTVIFDSECIKNCLSARDLLGILLSWLGMDPWDRKGGNRSEGGEGKEPRFHTWTSPLLSLIINRPR